MPVQAAEWDEYYGKLVTMLAAGQSLDLTEISSEGLHLSASKQIIKPIDDLVVKDKGELQEYFSDIAPSLPEAAMYKGNPYYLPWLHGTPILYYSTKIFKEAGVERPADDWTVNDVTFAIVAGQLLTASLAAYAFARLRFPGRDLLFMLLMSAMMAPCS